MSRVGVEVILTTGRTLKQGRGMELGKMSREYFEAVSVCELDEVTMSVLGVKNGDTVRVETYEGSVTVRVQLGRGLGPGMAFIPVGPYANAVIGADTSESGMPEFKRISAMIFNACGEPVPTIRELLLL